MTDQMRDLIVLALVGIVAGFLASILVGGGGLLYYLIIGIIGAFVGGYVLRTLGINLGISDPLISLIVTATIGAVIVVLLARLIGILS